MAARPWYKAWLPHGLLARSLLIMVTPMVLVELISTYVFFDAHWGLVTRRLAEGLAGDIGGVIALLQDAPEPGDQQRILALAQDKMQLDVTVKPGATLARTGMVGAIASAADLFGGSNLEDNLTAAMRNAVGRPFFIDADSQPRRIDIQVQLPEGVLDIVTARDRLYSYTTSLVVLWMVGSSLLLVGIATLFMRNQVRAVQRLAAAADSFGKGRDVPEFRPGGATEVRQAAAAFSLMRQRLKRQIDQRTEMLAGVSHDLRTPLTRMKLQLEMMSGEEAAYLVDDLKEMEHMVEGYLAFARGEGTEEAEPTDLVALLEDIVSKFRRDGAAVDLHCEEEMSLLLRPHAIGRVLSNLIGNAVRHAGHVAIRAGWRGGAAEILVDDDGPGIPADRREDVFKPFFRLESSRNPRTGGVGLGLTIALDIVRTHGGTLALEDSPLGGLRARVRLPT